MPALIHFGQISLTGVLKIAAMLSYTIMVFPEDANASAQQVESEIGTVGIQVLLWPEGHESEGFVIEYSPKNKTLKVWPTGGKWRLGRASEEALDFLKDLFWVGP